MSEELALFDLPAPEPWPTSARSGQGRARERCTRTVTADVTVQRMPVLLDTALRAFDNGPAVELGEIDDADEVPDSREQIGQDPAAALRWLLDPLDRIWPPLEASSALALSAEIEVDELSTARYRFALDGDDPTA